MWGAEQAWVLSACWYKPTSEGCAAHWGLSPSGHTPRNVNSVLDIQSTTTCRKDPLPWTTRFSHMEESQMSRAVQALPGCGLTPAKVRTARQGQELQEGGGDVMPWVSRPKGQSKVPQGQRDGTGCVGNAVLC